MQKTANTLSKNIRAKSVAVLNRHLAAAIDLHAQVKQAHWNVRGPTFIGIHKLFDGWLIRWRGTQTRSPNAQARLAAQRREPSRLPSNIRFFSDTGSASLMPKRS